MFSVDIPETEQLQRRLLMTTCLEIVPPLGFDPQPSVVFQHPEEVADLHKGLIFFRTCSNTILLPVVNEYETLLETMQNSMLHDLFTDE